MMCKFRDRDSTATSDQASSLSYTLTQSRQWVAKKTQMTTLVMLLGLGGGFCLATEVITPQLAQADTAHVNLSLQGQPNETYEALLSRAEAVAKTAAGAKFDGDNRVTDVSIMLVAQNHGAIAPVLTLEVSRSQWRSRPDVEFWSTYFTTARSLLGFEDLATTGQPDTATPGSLEQPEDATLDSATEDINSTSDEAETATPASTPEQSTPDEAETATPTTTPSQTPDSGTDQSPQSPDAAVPVDPSEDSQSPPNSDSPGFPSISTPTDAQRAPLAVPPPSGTTNNNLTPTNVPESSIPNNNPAPTPIAPNGTIPGTIQPTTPENLNNTIPETTPNQNVTPNGT